MRAYVACLRAVSVPCMPRPHIHGIPPSHTQKHVIIIIINKKRKKASETTGGGRKISMLGNHHDLVYKKVFEGKRRMDNHCKSNPYWLDYAHRLSSLPSFFHLLEVNSSIPFLVFPGSYGV